MTWMGIVGALAIHVDDALTTGTDEFFTSILVYKESPRGCEFFERGRETVASKVFGG
jgi:hypothetical protein